MIKAIIFDFGSVIYKTDWESLNKEFRNKFHVSILLTEHDDEELLRIYRDSDIGKEDFKKFFYRIGLKDTNKALDEYKKLYLKHKIWNEDLICLIKRLKKKYLLFGFTDVKQDNFDSNQKSGLYKDFQQIFTSFALGALKSDIMTFDKVCQELIKYHLKPTDCLFIDDHLPNIENARKRGFKTIHYTDFPNIDSFLQDLRKLLDVHKL